jgi:hypothetical protein
VNNLYALAGFMNYFSLLRFVLTSPGLAALATGKTSAGEDFVCVKIVSGFTESFAAVLSATGLMGLTGMVSASLSSAAVLPELSLPIMMSVVTHPSWGVSLSPGSRNRNGAVVATAWLSLKTGDRGAKILLVYSFVAAQLAANATMLIKTTACNILTVCMAVTFNFRGITP